MKKILTMTILFIIIANAFCSCFAVEVGTVEVKALRWCESYLKYNESVKASAYAAYLKDGKYYPAYCIDPDLTGVGLSGRTEYNVVGNSKLQNEKIWRVLINGYPYKSLQELGAANEDEAFYATKFAIYAMMYNDSNYQPVGSDASKRVHKIFLKILNDAKVSTEVLNGNNEISVVPESNNWTIDSKDESYISKTYKVNSLVSNGTYNLKIEGALPEGSFIASTENHSQTIFKIGEKFKILIPIKNINGIGKFTIKVESELETKPIIVGKTTVPGTQNYALTGYMMEDASCSYDDEYIDNTTKINVIKREFGSEKTLSGVKFNLLDANQNIIKEDLITDENGQIILEKMIPGKYFIKETETIDGYNLYNDLIEINLRLNEEIDVVVNNTLKTVTEVEKDTETIQVNSKYSEETYSVNNSQKIVNENNVKKLPVTGF